MEPSWPPLRVAALRWTPFGAVPVGAERYRLLATRSSLGQEPVCPGPPRTPPRRHAVTGAGAEAQESLRLRACGRPAAPVLPTPGFEATRRAQSLGALGTWEFPPPNGSSRGSF